MAAFASILSFLSLVFGALHFVKLGSPWGARFMIFRIAAGALSPVWALFGIAGAALGLVRRNPLVAAAGLAGAVASGRYIVRTRKAAEAYAPPVFDALATPVDVCRDVVVRGTSPLPSGEPCERPLYADLWAPAGNLRRSGLGVVYLHGSAWYLGDKGQLTGPLFRALAADGHVVLDVAYRMCPETDIRGMVADGRASIGWLKEHAAELDLDPGRLVVGGTSAGGHIALVTAYTVGEDNPLLPEDDGIDASVAGVFTISAPVDMPAMLDYHPNLANSGEPGAAYDPLTDVDPVAPPRPGASQRERMRWNRAQARRLNGLLRDLLGGGPDEAPEMFEFATVRSHARPGLPPTLLIQGDQDTLVPVEATRRLSVQLRDAGACVEYVELPQTDHGFELALPQVSPPALAALAAIRRFLRTL